MLNEVSNEVEVLEENWKEGFTYCKFSDRYSIVYLCFEGSCFRKRRNEDDLVYSNIDQDLTRLEMLHWGSRRQY